MRRTAREGRGLVKFFGPVHIDYRKSHILANTPDDYDPTTVRSGQCGPGLAHQGNVRSDIISPTHAGHPPGSSTLPRATNCGRECLESPISLQDFPVVPQMPASKTFIMLSAWLRLGTSRRVSLPVEIEGLHNFRLTIAD